MNKLIWQNKFIRGMLFIFAAITVIATSKGRDYTEPIYNWIALSTCAGAISTEVISTQGYSIIAPANRTFLNFGLPVERMKISVDKTVSASDGATTRECQHTTVEISGKQVETYTCIDNMLPACVVSFEPN